MRDSGVISPTFDQAKNHNKRFGEFEYFGGSDVVNKLQVWSLELAELYMYVQCLTIAIVFELI